MVMATLQRGRKPESVQFWLAIAALSLAFHSLFLFGIQRWAKVAVLQPEVSGPIDVELRDAAPAKPDVNEGAIAQVPQQPEVVPQTKLEAKPQPVESEPEVVQKPDPKREPELKPELPIVPPVKSTVPVPKSETPQKPKSTKKPLTKPEVGKPEVGKPEVGKPEVGKPLTPPDQTTGRDLTVNLPVPKLLSAPGEIGGKGTARLRLKSPLTIPFPATFSLKSGDVIRAKVKFIVTGKDFQSPEIKELSPKLSGRDQDQLLALMEEFLTQISVEKIEIDTDAVEKPDTEWETTIELRL
jgi:outer membrane biosynthesis protein TonB